MAGVQKRKIQWVISLFLVMLYFSGLPVQAQYGGGTGEPNDPYLIYTAEQMNEIGLHEEDWDKHFKLMADIDLAGYTGTAFNIIGYYLAWDDNNPYIGVFEGNGRTISNFSYSSTDVNNIGLFGCVKGKNAEIKDLRLIDPNIDAGTAYYTGALVGRLYGGTITNCYAEGGSVSGEHRIGGMVGYNSGTIINCYANSSVMGYEYVGGIVGYNSGIITNCCASGVITGNESVGGMVGYNSGTIINCFTTASVSGEHDIGGVVGYNYNGKIINCCASGSVTGYEYVGGMVGSVGYLPWWWGPPAPLAMISNCYSTGDVTGNRVVGGFAGAQTFYSTIVNCYSTGSVSGNADVGGLVGANLPLYPDFSGITGDTISNFYSTADITGNSGVGQPVVVDFGARVINSFWDTETSGQHTSAGGRGKTTAGMQTASTFLDAGWDFVGESVNGTEDIWWILEGQDYPRLIWELPEGLRLRPLPAFSPNPRDGSTDVTQSPILHWAPAEPTLQHDIYFGEDKEVVANATALSLGIYRGRQPGELTTYYPGTLEWSKTYYWRIDEVNEADPNSLWKGSVWSFTTANFLIVDDFESYNDLDPADPKSNRIFNTWIDVLETTTLETTTIGAYFLFPFPVHSGIAHGGFQSMRYGYDNSGPPYYSEATANIANLAIDQDWTQDGIGVLSLWFNGDPNNAPEPMYVALANANGSTAVVYHDNPDAALKDTWTQWNIDLQAFADQGVNLANVNTIALGLGNKKNPVAGGSGKMYFDDIRLYRPAP